MFYRYFADKEDLLAALAESFLHDVVDAVRAEPAPAGLPEDDAFFTAVVTGYWNMFKQNIGIMIAVAQLAATQQRFAAVQNEFRRFGMDIVARLGAPRAGAGLRRRARSRTHRGGHRAAVRELHHRLRRHDAAARGSRSATRTPSRTLSTIWKKTLYGF